MVAGKEGVTWLSPAHSCVEFLYRIRWGCHSLPVLGPGRAQVQAGPAHGPVLAGAAEPSLVTVSEPPSLGNKADGHGPRWGMGARKLAQGDLGWPAN